MGGCVWLVDSLDILGAGFWRFRGLLILVDCSASGSLSSKGILEGFRLGGQGVDEIYGWEALWVEESS